MLNNRQMLVIDPAATVNVALAQRTKPRILLVEDDVEDVLLLRNALARSEVDFAITHVTRLSEALGQASCEYFDLILLDLALPDSQGLGALVSLHAVTESLPIVVFTSLADENLALTALRMGAQDYLIKGTMDGRLLSRSLRYAVERQQLLSELAEANTKIKAFTAMMVHDLRCPLYNIIAIGDAMIDDDFGPVNSEQKTWLGRIVSSGRQLVDLTTNFLDLSKLEAGHMEVIKKPTDLKRLLSATVDNYQLVARAKQITVRNNVAATTGIVEADLKRLEQVLTNLLSNALKFTPAGGEIEIGAARAENEARVWVRDTGVGIAAEEIGQVFEKYKQTTSGKNSLQQGTGLGLVICRTIVEAHGGTIWVESAPGRGSTFFFTLPIDRQKIIKPAGEHDL